MNKTKIELEVEKTKENIKELQEKYNGLVDKMDWLLTFTAAVGVYLKHFPPDKASLWIAGLYQKGHEKLWGESILSLLKEREKELKLEINKNQKMKDYLKKEGVSALDRINIITNDLN